MSRLRKEMGISEKLLASLNENKIFTVLDYLQEDSEKLSSACNTSFKVILEVKHNLITNLSALPIHGMSAYENLLSSSALIPSGIESLDTLLQGGFLTGMVIELCGLSGDGKTQLCFTISAHVAAALKQSVHYVDTKGDFSAQRVLGIIKHKNIPEEECAAALERIQVTRISDIYELLRFLHHLKSCLGEDESIPPRVVIVDSVPPLYFPFMASDTNQGFGLLNNMMSMMKVMATEYHILFIVVNLASTFVEAEVCDNEGAEDNRDAITSDVRPMLGKYWLHAPNMRLLVSKLNSEAAQRLIRVTKSTYLQTGASCVVCVSEKGVV
ncbi:DNA repair protein RAD51 homolog 4-like [Homalodisca vitripennis]|uniref:DNA repair protein RAD51 homolog 4-like n=1 Tax=Homalodisca vitripennis TaxID=197043 RepID=UPI001EECCD27|nr:DNA repair protein RAD51 homolog 4-like [Homalodisca vitripennis]